MPTIITLCSSSTKTHQSSYSHNPDPQLCNQRQVMGSPGRSSRLRARRGSSLAAGISSARACLSPTLCCPGRGCVPCLLLLVPKPGAHRGCPSVAEQVDGQTDDGRGPAHPGATGRASPALAPACRHRAKKWSKARKLPKRHLTVAMGPAKPPRAGALPLSSCDS